MAQSRRQDRLEGCAIRKRALLFGGNGKFLHHFRIQVRISGLWKNETFLTKKKYRNRPIFPAITAASRQLTRCGGLNAPRRMPCAETPTIATVRSSRRPGRTCCGGTTLCSARIRAAGKGLRLPASRWSSCKRRVVGPGFAPVARENPHGPLPHFTAATRGTSSGAAALKRPQGPENPWPEREASDASSLSLSFGLLPFHYRRRNRIAPEVELVWSKLQRRGQLELQVRARRKVNLFAASSQHPDCACRRACGASNPQAAERVAARHACQSPNFSPGD